MMTLFESPTGLQFVMNTDVQSADIRELLTTIYTQAFVEHVVKNPLLNPAEPIQSDIFRQKLNELVAKHPAARATNIL
ncbi:unnamed protein product [Cyprideis torosa]|nr:unnamed protein product [Cyprideis torosa]CAG0908619.1 unnamed protein product [Cyprideis torosa]